MKIINKTIKNVGKIKIINEISDGDGRRVAVEFVNHLFENFCINCKKSISSWESPIFNYSERPLETALLPAIASITPRFLVEKPILRQDKDIHSKKVMNSSGRLDFWCKYRNVDFFIELKHCWKAFSRPNFRKDSNIKWGEIQRQLKGVRRDAKELARKTDNKGVFLLGIEVNAIFEDTDKSTEPKSKNDHNKLFQFQDNSQATFDPRPDWNGLWILRENLFEKSVYLYKDKSKEYYPGLLFIVKISKLIT